MSRVQLTSVCSFDRAKWNGRFAKYCTAMLCLVIASLGLAQGVNDTFFSDRGKGNDWPDYYIAYPDCRSLIDQQRQVDLELFDQHLALIDSREDGQRRAIYLRASELTLARSNLDDRIKACVRAAQVAARARIPDGVLARIKQRPVVSRSRSTTRPDAALSENPDRAFIPSCGSKLFDPICPPEDEFLIESAPDPGFRLPPAIPASSQLDIPPEEPPFIPSPGVVYPTNTTVLPGTESPARALTSSAPRPVNQNFNSLYDILIRGPDAISEDLERLWNRR